ncbi:MAG: hypothetical protein LUG86_08940 [Oscillospiraceae bacterium]|nr:hypothetical protein [Oscillospiraceae bacterium]
MKNSYMEIDTLLTAIMESDMLPVTDGTVLSALAPSMLQGRLVESAFLYDAPAPNNPLQRPYAWLTVDSMTGALVRFEYCFVQDFIDTEKYPIDMEIEYKPQPIKERMANGKAFRAAYEAVRPFLFTEPSELTEEQVRAISQLRETMTKAIPSELLPFYQSLAKEFITWLEKVLNY